AVGGLALGSSFHLPHLRGREWAAVGPGGHFLHTRDWHPGPRRLTLAAGAPPARVCAASGSRALAPPIPPGRRQGPAACPVPGRPRGMEGAVSGSHGHGHVHSHAPVPVGGSPGGGGGGV